MKVDITLDVHPAWLCKASHQRARINGAVSLSTTNHTWLVGNLDPCAHHSPKCCQQPPLPDCCSFIRKHATAAPASLPASLPLSLTSDVPCMDCAPALLAAPLSHRPAHDPHPRSKPPIAPSPPRYSWTAPCLLLRACHLLQSPPHCCRKATRRNAMQ
jgi:hypothetical protein